MRGGLVFNESRSVVCVLTFVRDLAASHIASGWCKFRD